MSYWLIYNERASGAGRFRTNANRSAGCTYGITHKEMGHERQWPKQKEDESCGICLPGDGAPVSCAAVRELSCCIRGRDPTVLR